MWRLWNKLFGWDYVSIRTGNGFYGYVKRLRHTFDGRRYVEFCGGVWFLLDNGKVDNQGYLWIPLTFTNKSEGE